MRHLKLTFIAVLCCFMSGAVVHANDMALTKDGTLFRIISTDDGLLLSSSSPDGSTYASLVPQTTDADISSITIGIDELNLTPYIFWQEGQAGNAKVLLATYSEGTWIGPIIIDGESQSAALNPQMIVRRETATVEVETETEGKDGEIEVLIETYEIETTLLHTVWWSQIEGEPGVGVYAAIPVFDDGSPDVAEALFTQLGDLLPYGIGCSGIEDTSALAFPKLFIDPTSGRVNVFSTDYSNCLFQIIEMEYEVVDWDNVEKRGRHSIILGRSVMMAIKPDLPLGEATVKVGRDLSIVLHWDVEDAVEYTRIDQDSWSETQHLDLSENLSHEQAVDLINALTR